MNTNYFINYKGKDITKFNLTERLYFARSLVNRTSTNDFYTTSMSTDEMMIIDKGLELLGPNPITVLETGFYCGCSFRLFMIHIAKYGGEVHSIDIYPYHDVMEQYKELGLYEYINLHLGDARQYQGFNKPVDFLNIDSEHSEDYVIREYNNFRNLLTEHHSLVGFHDFTLPGVRSGLKKIMEQDELEPVMILDTKASYGYGLYRLQWKDKKADYSEYALTEEQKSKMIFELDHGEIVNIP